jgi:hypothetical protein
MTLARSVLEFDVIGVGQILDRGLGPHFVGTLSVEKPARCGVSMVILVPDTTRLLMSTGSFAKPRLKRVQEDLDQDDTGQRQQHGCPGPQPAAPAPSGCGGRPRQSGLHSGDIGWVLYRIHRGSRGALDAKEASFYPQSRIMQPGDAL